MTSTTPPDDPAGCHAHSGSFECASCNKQCCMTCDAPRDALASLGVKTLGSRYCDACVRAAARDMGLSLEYVRSLREAHREQRIAAYRDAHD